MIDSTLLSMTKDEMHDGFCSLVAKAKNGRRIYFSIFVSSSVMARLTSDTFDYSECYAFETRQTSSSSQIK